MIDENKPTDDELEKEFSKSFDARLDAYIARFKQEAIAFFSGKEKPPIDGGSR
jgi:hypothetical protein